MGNKINWTYISLALGYKIKSLEEKVMICNCCEEYTHNLDAVKNELAIYKEEYRKVLIEQQKQ